MNPKCAGAQQLEAGTHAPGAAAPLRGRRKEDSEAPALLWKGSVVVYVMLGRRFSFDCTAPQSPQIRPILMGYLGFKSSFQLSPVSKVCLVLLLPSVPLFSTAVF